MNRSEQILLAAEHCMRQKGFHQTSIQNIAEEASISIGLIYKYYKNKEAIIEALVISVVERMIALLNADFRRIAHRADHRSPSQDIVPPEVEKSITLLMEISSEATRNPAIEKILNDAWQKLKDNFIAQELALNPGQNASIINTRLHVMSLLIDGVIIRRCMKQRDISADFMAFLDTLIQELYPNSAA
ncbi:TetR/AcrR family transcriptional regulator [Candidatus Pantoea deserta]|uniref:TetR/AcrR family transcriptional regulator n=1 Tax=Candidatus Pantoea deserta TaxID=1869313 RepID=A0A3N4PPZ4_9GAMM|nr:TetR/AcrR family transcriptional regulator [Pantoea deserta]